MISQLISYYFANEEIDAGIILKANKSGQNVYKIKLMDMETYEA